MLSAFIRSTATRQRRRQRRGAAVVDSDQNAKPGSIPTALQAQARLRLRLRQRLRLCLGLGQSWFAVSLLLDLMQVKVESS